MTLSTVLNYIEQFVVRWGGTTMPRIFIAFVGLVICMAVLIALWERRIRMFTLVMGLLLGLLLILAAVNPKVLHYLVGTSFITRIRFVMVVLSFLVVVITLEAIRRSHLQERYAILWITTGLLILLAAFFPRILDIFTIFLGTQYVTSVVGVVFIFLLLIVFHFSIALSGIQKKQSQIAQRCAILEVRVRELAADLTRLRREMGSEGKLSEPALSVNETDQPAVKPLVGRQAESSESPSGFLNRKQGAAWASYGIILVAFIAVLIVGAYAPQAMVGDEVTHYFMLTTQSENLAQPNFFANIPTGWGEVERRRYPHSCFWHYAGALLYRLTGGSFYAVQAYQSLLWLQFLVMAYLLARSLLGFQGRAVILYMLVLATLPVCLIFSVTFYQDVPMAAQVLTAFYLLHRQRWLWATFFMGLALAMKISALLFIPPFLLCLGVWHYRKCRGGQTVFAVGAAIAVLTLFTLGISWSLKHYAQADFYAFEQILKSYSKIQRAFAPKQAKVAVQPHQQAKDRVTPYEAHIIANHPGDLRIAENYIVYGGGILWIVVLVGGMTIGIIACRRQTPHEQLKTPWWFFCVGIWYTILTAYFLRTAPDARFFLPGIPFILLPFAEAFSRLPRFKIFLCLIAALAILQGGQVLKKTYDLRHVPRDLQEGIAFLQAAIVTPARIFMYPEGNYRLFPYRHDWYLNYRLREFWRADNDKRIDMLRQFRIGGIVVKKHLIADVDPGITNLGVYPTYFVKDLKRDQRFVKLFENSAVFIYRVP